MDMKRKRKNTRIIYMQIKRRLNRNRSFYLHSWPASAVAFSSFFPPMPILRRNCRDQQTYGLLAEDVTSLFRARPEIPAAPQRSLSALRLSTACVGSPPPALIVPLMKTWVAFLFFSCLLRFQFFTSSPRRLR